MNTRSTTRRSRRPAVIVAVLAMLLKGLIAGPMAGLADDIQPAAETASCATAPIDDVRYAEVAADRGDDVAIPEPIPYRVAEGAPADAATVDRVEAVVEQVVTCVNEGRNGAFLSLFTSDFLERHVGEMGVPFDDIQPTPIPTDMRLSLVRVADVMVLDDGRISALVVLDQTEREAPELTSVLTFKALAGLLIDEWQPVTLPDNVVATPTPTPTPTPVAGTWEMVSGPGYTGVIAPLEEAPTLRTGYGTTASGYWLPDAGMIAELEAGLPGYLLTFSFESIPSVADRVDTYLRQYAGLVIEGRALIFVNALCQDPTDGRWTSEPVFVDDGGDCFFQLYYEPATGGFRELSINGDA